MVRFAIKDELLDAQTLRAAGTAPYDGADIGECLATARRVRGTDLTSWYQEWTATARRMEQLAERTLTDGGRRSARSAFFRASTYYRTAGVMLLGTPVDPRLLASNTAQSRAFQAGAALLDTPPEAVKIPYEGTVLPGYFFAVDTSGLSRPTVVLLGGYDGTAEELYFLNGAAALARGYNVLAFDGPGQGSALLQQHLLIRPDWEAVIGPVLDLLVVRSDVDTERIALIGLSLGAHLGPRAAAAEPRVAALIADCGSYDLFAAALEHMPGPLARGFARNSPRARKIVAAAMHRLISKPTAGWAIRRGQLVHGVDSPTEYLDALREFTLAPYAPRIACPTLVCSAEHDDISASAGQLAAALTCPHEHLRFATEDGAGDHCEAAARVLYHALSFDWLDKLLQPVP